MKVIFLDVDGVLNSDEYINKAKSLNIQGIEKHVDVEKIKLLKKAVDETGAKVVLSSSYRYTKDAPCLIELLAHYGIFVDSTPYIQNERGLEIKEYMAQFSDLEDYVIVDDELFPSFDEELLKHFVRISNGNGTGLGDGLLPKDIDEIIKRLERIKSKCKENEELEK